MTFQDPVLKETSPDPSKKLRRANAFQNPWQRTTETVSQQVPQVRWQDSWQVFLQAKVQGLSPADHMTLGMHYVNHADFIHLF